MIVIVVGGGGCIHVDGIGWWCIAIGGDVTRSIGILWWWLIAISVVVGGGNRCIHIEDAASVFAIYCLLTYIDAEIPVELDRIEGKRERFVSCCSSKI